MISIVLGIAVLLIFSYYLWKDRKNIERSSIMFIRRTDKGIKALDMLSKAPGLKALYTFAIPLAVIGMGLILLMVGLNAFYILKVPEAPPGLSPIIPGVRIPGAPLFVPFWYGILALATLLFVHEGSHGIASRVEKIKVKSTGLLLALVIPGAFVEPLQKQFDKARPLSRLRVAAAGSFANILTAFICIALIVLVLNTAAPRGPVITATIPDTPAAEAFKEMSVIRAIDGEPVEDFWDMLAILNRTKPNQTVYFSVVQAEEEEIKELTIPVTTTLMPNTTDRGFVGIPAEGVGAPTTNFLFLALPLQAISVIKIVHPLFWGIDPESPVWYLLYALKWTAFLNFAIGIVNLLPVQPLDGGLILKELVGKVSHRLVRPVTAFFSFLVLFLFLVNILPYFL